MFERTSSILVVFLNGYEHIEVLLNPCEITQDQKFWNTILRLHSSHTKKCLRGWQQKTHGEEAG